MMTDFLVEGYVKTRQREYLKALIEVINGMQLENFAS